MRHKMHYNKKKYIFLLLVLGLLFALSGCSSKDPVKYSNTGFAMGTTISEVIYGEDEKSLEQNGQDIMNLLGDVERKQISWRMDSSEIYRVNHSHGSVEVSHDVYEWIKESLTICEDTDGALNPGIGVLAHLWDIGGDNARVPSEDEIKEAKKQIDANTINIEETDKISIESDQVQVDLGAVGKGAAADSVMRYLKSVEDISGALISVGGSLCVYGEKPDQSSWTVGIQDPRAEDGCMLGKVEVSGGTFVSTSGDYEKYIEQDGKRYHHILDSKTGYPSQSGLISVTIVCESGIDSDALSTACFVLGMKKSIPLLEKYHAQAVFVDEEHGVCKTDGVKFTLDNTNDYEMKEIK